MKAKKIMSLAMVAALSLSSFAAVGCNRGGNTGDEGDPDKTKIYVGVFEGGYGAAWAEAAAARFEAIYGDTIIEEGKTGIDIIVKAHKSFNGPSLATSPASWTQDIYFTELLTSYNTLVNEGAILEITDIVTETLSAYGENTSLENKMNPDRKAWFKTEDNKYYGIPYYEGAYTLNYDIDLFEEECLFFAENGVDFIATPGAPKSKGPDNLPNTVDDGLPATYDDFFRLLDKMVDKSITPIMWAGNFKNYLHQTMMSLWADYEGKDNATAHFTFDKERTIDVVSSFDDSGNPVITQTSVTAETGYKVFKQPGLYYALEFLERIVTNEAYYDYNDCFGTMVDNLTAQSNYIHSKPSGNPIGILVEGGWWYNEAKAAFDSLADRYGEEQKDRHFGVMTLPKATSAQVGESQTLYDILCSASFINAKIEPHKIEMAKKFLQFCYTQESCVEFTKNTSATLPYDYTMTTEDLAATSSFGQQNYALHNTTTYFLPTNRSDLFLAKPALAEAPAFWQTFKYGNLPCEELVNGVTAKEYFEDISNYYNQTTWVTAYLPR